ncbi:MAG: penicillin acylase family protein [Rhizobiaceae bacterium]|nr:penicillin acylase family protein [Rhizobiaceae bacterium]
MIEESAAVQRLRVDGPSETIEILIDRWGVPHIYAQSDLDAFVGQGFAVARDRLWQIDVWRKRGLGRLAADYGPSFAEADRAARLLLYRGDMNEEWPAYGEGSRAIAEAFVRGINAYIDLIESEPQRLPIEFARTGTTPERWNPEDCVRIRSHGPLFNFARELVRANVIQKHGIDADLARRRLEPEWSLIQSEGIASEPIPPEVKRTFELGTAPPGFAGTSRSSETDIGGSNNWAVSGDRTTTGRPILASDPHRLLLLPSLRYVSHLNSPGLDVIGAGEPGVPGIAVGHNETSAFCFTIHPADQSDLYVYELHPDDHSLYRYGDAWERMTQLEETLVVKGQDDLTVTLAFTRHGPVLHIDDDKRRAYALRSIWSAAGSAPYMGALRYLKVSSWDDFVAARANWLTPTVNHVYADAAGSIGWIMSGFVPVRPQWDGLLPVPGDGSREWAGYMPPEAHARIHNPKRGWVATANEMNLPPDFDYRTYKPGFEWCDPARYDAIARELNKATPHSLDDSRDLQTSFASPTAERLLAFLRGFQPGDDKARKAIRLFAGWNGEIAPQSGAAMLFELWFRKHLIEAVMEQLAPGAFGNFEAGDIAGLDTLQVTDLVVQPDDRFAPQPTKVRDAIVERTLAAAWREAVQRCGDDYHAWRWDNLHHAKFSHPLSPLLGESVWDTPRVGKGGSGLTPNAADYRPDDFLMTVGASFRMVLDVGNWDNGVFVNAPGQSGDPASPHYQDHLETWGREDYFPMLFSRDEVEAATELRIVLEPGLPA